jgi:predicted Fe-S protein YdhL (DUF1289 family)
VNSPAGVRSPCINVCRMDDDSGWCEGCLRTLDEIAKWGPMADAERLVLRQQLALRRRERRRLRSTSAESPT